MARKLAQSDDDEPPSEEKARAIAKLLLDGDVNSTEVERKLIERGVDQQTARRIVDELRSPAHSYGSPSPSEQERGRKNIAFGLLWIVGGLLFTAISYAIAGEGGSFLLAWGAIIGGLIQFFRGTSQVWDERPTLESPEEEQEIETDGQVEHATSSTDAMEAPPQSSGSESETNVLIRVLILLAVGLGLLSLAVCFAIAVSG